MGLFSQIKEQQKEQKAKKEELKNIFKEGGDVIAFALCDYLGGHPDLMTNGQGMFSVNKTGLLFVATLSNNAIFIPINDVIKAEFKTDEQISKDVTLTRLLAFGIFAFGMKKKRREVTNYLIVTITVAGIEGTVLFESKIASKLASAVVKAKQLNPATNNVGVTIEKVDIPEQIRKLSELKEQGILTDEEFTLKKSELLAKM